MANEIDDMMLDDDQVELLERAVSKLVRRGDNTLRELVAEQVVVEDDEMEQTLQRAAAIDALLPEDGDVA